MNKSGTNDGDRPTAEETSRAGIGPDEAMESPPWEDIDPMPAEPPDEWLHSPHDFSDGEPPPQLVRTVNLLPHPEHDLSGPEDIDGIAEFLLERAKEGIADIFAHEDYARQDEEGEALARAIAEHQTGAPYTMPAYFYGSQKKVASAIVDRGLYPLVGQCQQSVTTALCFGGWNGGTYGDIGSGFDAQPTAMKLGQGWDPPSLMLSAWTEDLWQEVTVGSCLFWSAPCTCDKRPHAADCKGPGNGHVALVIRKHPTERLWQLWDTTTSFNDPSAHAAVVKGARMLWESHWWPYIPKTLSNGNWQFRGIARIAGLDTVRSDLRPQGRCRLLLTRRSDKKLLFRTAWLSMEAEGLPVSWLLRSVRGAPFADQIEAMWCVNSPADGAGSAKNTPLLDVSCDAQGNAMMSWRPTQGYHGRPNPANWNTEAPFPQGATPPETRTNVAPSPAPSAAPARPAEGALLRNEPLASHGHLQKIASKEAYPLRHGASGPHVKAFQEALILLVGEIAGGADGSFGAGSTHAVKTFQAAHGLEADGVAGAGTLLALDAKLAEKNTR